ncbi:MAG: FAD-binding oxidoreductase [bacterium]
MSGSRAVHTESQGLDPAALKELRTLLPPERVSDEPVDLLTYAYDATRRQYPPQVVLWPETAQEIAAVLRLASERGIPVYPRGGGTGLTGGSLATRGGIALSLERMTAIRGVERQNRLVTAQAGVPLGELKAVLQKQGLFYPPDPSSAKTATLGGSLAECAGGLNCVKYGTTKDWVQAIEAVLPTGEIVHIGSKARKSVVGYNLLQLLIGSEGTLAVITEAALRLVPFPPHRGTFIALFDSVQDSARAVQRMLDSGAVPCAIEFIDRRSLEAVNAYSQDASLPVAEALLLVEADGHDLSRVEEETRTFAALCQESGATQITLAQSDRERERLWDIRRSLNPAMYAKAPFKTNEDICVPISEIGAILDAAYEIGNQYNITTLCFGHAGDGNIHVNFMTHDEEDPQVDQAVADLFERTVALGGSISGEHGIGITKAPFLGLEMGKRERQLLADIKKLFDPKNILNPGKMDLG